MHGGWQHFSPTLLVEEEEAYLYSRLLSMHFQECGRVEKGRNTYVLAPLCRPGRAGCGEAMGIGAQRAREWSTKIQPKAS
jgi:hypothetical protein